jgi:hypothetical protein
MQGRKFRLGQQRSRIADLGEEINGRKNIKFLHHTVGSFVEEKAGNFTLRIIEVAENDCAGGT